MTALLISGLKAMGQDAQEDFQLRLNLEGEMALNKYWMLNLGAQTRFQENATRFNYTRLNAGAVYRLSKNWRIAGTCLYAIRNKTDQTLSHRQQFRVSLTYRHKLGDFALFNRLMFRGQFKDVNSDAQGQRFRDMYLRNKVTLRYRHFDKVTPYIAAESFYQFDRSNYLKGFNRTRLYIGFFYNLTDIWLAETTYAIELKRDSKIPVNTYFLSLGLSRTFFQ